MEDLADQTIELLEPFYEDAAGATTRVKYRKKGKVDAHVKPLPAVKVKRLLLEGVDVSHNLWFFAQPGYTEAYRLRWVEGDTILRPEGCAVDLHGLGEIWLGAAKAITPDNEKVEIVQ